MTTPSAARSNNFGVRTYPVPTDDGEVLDLPSVTGILRVLASPALETWKIKTVAAGLSKRPDLVVLAATDSYRAARQALDAEQAAANVGTGVHGLTELAERGALDLDTVPDGARNHVRHYLDVATAFRWQVVASEQSVYNLAAGYAGTFDRILDVPGHGRVVADIKTGKGVYPEVALQLAFYANAEGIWDGTEKLALPEGTRTDLALVIHLRDDGCRVVPVDLTGAWEVCKALCEAHRWQARKDVVGAPLTVEPADIRAWLVAQIDGLDGAALADLAAHWPPTRPTAGAGAAKRPTI